MKKTIVEVNHIVKRYKSGQGEQAVVKDVSLTMKEGEFVSIMGASGSGKSTLLYAMSGLDRVSEGSVSIEGKSLQELNEKQLSAFRLSHMGFVFQQSHMLKNLNLYDNILLPAALAHGKDRSALCRRVDELMKQTGIYEQRSHAIHAVSGGQLQRAGICRALINQPKILFADEPTGALNSKASREIMDIFTRLHREGCGIALVTHDSKVSIRSERVLFMKDGEIQGELVLGAYEGNDKAREQLVTEQMIQYDL